MEGTNPADTLRAAQAAQREYSTPYGCRCDIGDAVTTITIVVSNDHLTESLPDSEGVPTYRSCNLALPKGVLHDGFSLSGWSKFDRNEDGSLKLGSEGKPIKTGSGLWIGLRLPSSKKATAKKGAKGGKGALAGSGI